MTLLETLTACLSLWVIVPLVGLSVLYVFATWNNGYFSSKGIPGPKPTFLLGHMPAIMRSGMGSFDQEVLTKYGNIAGIFVGRSPMLLLADVDILKQVMIKEFGSFTNRSTPITFQTPADKMMFLLKDDAWRRVRNHTTPAFTGGRLRRMCSHVNMCCRRLVGNLEGEVEVRPIIARFTMDIIASTGYGMDIDSQTSPDSHFAKMANEMINFGGAKLGLVFSFPFLFNILTKFGMTIFPKESTHYFSSIIEKAMLHRKKEGDESEMTSSTDLLQLMVDAEKNVEDAETTFKGSDESITRNTRKGLTHDEILGQAILLFFASFDTVANSLTYFLHNMAVNPECQNKVFDEIKEVIGELDHLDLDIVNKMTYLDMALNETLRLNPSAPRTDRDCNRDITINGVHFEKGLSVGISIRGLHYDPKVWPNPTKFDPERFSEEQKAMRDPISFQPFGMGPRHCVGMRLALLEMKMAVVYILRNYRIVKCDKTLVPLPRNTLERPNNCVLRFEPRA